MNRDPAGKAVDVSGGAVDDDLADDAPVAEPPTWVVRLMWIAWPAFLLAGVMEILVFAFVDPQDLTWRGHALGLSRVGTYSMAFFAFWIVIAAACSLTSLLAFGTEDPPNP